MAKATVSRSDESTNMARVPMWLYEAAKERAAAKKISVALAIDELYREQMYPDDRRRGGPSGPRVPLGPKGHRLPGLALLHRRPDGLVISTDGTVFGILPVDEIELAPGDRRDPDDDDDDRADDDEGEPAELVCHYHGIDATRDVETRKVGKETYHVCPECAREFDAFADFVDDPAKMAFLEERDLDNQEDPDVALEIDTKGPWAVCPVHARSVSQREAAKVEIDGHRFELCPECAKEYEAAEPVYKSLAKHIYDSARGDRELRKGWRLSDVRARDLAPRFAEADAKKKGPAQE